MLHRNGIAVVQPSPNTDSASLRVHYRIPSPPQAPPAPKRAPIAWIVGLSLLTMAMGGAGMFFAWKALLPSGVALDPWTLPEAPVAPLSWSARWISAPLVSPSGVVFGMVDAGATPAVVAIDGATGSLRWKTPLEPGAPLADYRHANGWNLNGARVPTEFQPNVPVMGLAGAALVIAFDHGWAMFDVATGALRKSGRIDTTLPAVAPQGGFCAMGNDAWIAMADGRDGGLQITASGTTTGLRLDRPAGCAPPIGTREEPYGHRTSPLQRARGNQVPSDCMRTRHKARTKTNECNWWGQSPSGVAVAADYTTIFFGDDSFSFRKTSGNRFSLLGVEAAAKTLFVTVSESASFSTETKPPPGSFAPVERQSGYRYRVVLAAVDEGVRPRWTTTLATLTDNWAHPLVFAADPASPTQYLYLFTPGKLVALDQATGEARFRIEAN